MLAASDRNAPSDAGQVVPEAEQPRRVEANRDEQNRELIGGERRPNQRHADRAATSAG